MQGVGHSWREVPETGAGRLERTTPSFRRVQPRWHGKNLNDMATALLIRLRSKGERWSLTAAAAGHPPAVLVSDEGTTLLGGGEILGAWEGAEPACRTATLSAGDTLVLCTDGWYEAGPPTTHEHGGGFG